MRSKFKICTFQTDTKVAKHFSSPKTATLKHLDEYLPQFNTCNEESEESEQQAKTMLESVVSCMKSVVIQDDQESPTSPESPTQLSPDQYKVLDTIGQGSFGKVKKALHLISDQVVAVKSISKAEMAKTRGSSERLLREIYIWNNLQHPHICPLYQVMENETKFYLVMEYEPRGDLLDFIQSRAINGRGLEERLAQKLFIKIVDAVRYCHSFKIAHRDIKPENILLDDKLEPKLVDFGFANVMRDDMLVTACGSIAYSAPEIIARKQYNGMLSDAWSCGILLYSMLSACLPFDDPKTSKLVTKIITQQYEMKDYFSEKAKEIISNLVLVDLKARMKLDDLVKLEWMKGETVQQIDSSALDPIIIEEMKLYGVDTDNLENTSFPDFPHATYQLLRKRRRQMRNFSSALACL